MVGILKGGYKFFNVLADKLQALNGILPTTVPLQMEFIKAKSYENDQSTGKLTITGTDNIESWTGEQRTVSILVSFFMLKTRLGFIKVITGHYSCQCKQIQKRSDRYR